VMGKAVIVWLLVGLLCYCFIWPYKATEKVTELPKAVHDQMDVSV